MPGDGWAADVLARRRREREEKISTARAYVDAIARKLDLIGAAVIGSVARGDFNVWSDIDVVVVADGLPSRYLDRASLLARVPARGVQAVAFTPEELTSSLAKGDPRAEELRRLGVYLAGEQQLRALLCEPPQGRGG